MHMRKLYPDFPLFLLIILPNPLRKKKKKKEMLKLVGSFQSRPEMNWPSVLAEPDECGLCFPDNHNCSAKSSTGGSSYSASTISRFMQTFGVTRFAVTLDTLAERIITKSDVTSRLAGGTELETAFGGIQNCFFSTRIIIDAHSWYWFGDAV